MPEKKKFRLVRELEEMVKAYFAACEETEIYPEEAGLILHLGLQQEEYERYKSGEMGKGYSVCLNKAQLRRESILMRDLYGTSRTSSGKLFVAKQVKTAKPDEQPGEEKSKLTIEVRLSGESSDYFD